MIRVSHSGINYKDALAATGAGKILRRYPLVGGIDLAGVVESSSDARFAKGDGVLVTGCALSETHDGGYAKFARVKGDWVIPLPAGLSAHDAMAIGTAGFTAAFAIDRMEQNGQDPAGGPIVVTGASGGVGSIAIDMLATRGYRVIAVSGKAAAAQYLTGLGASEVLARADLDLGSRALETARFGGAIDNLGGEVLTWLTRTVDFWGNIASIGLAGGTGTLDHGDALHPARRHAARHQLLGHPARAPRGGVAAHRGRPEAAPPGAHRHAHHRLRGTAGGLPRLPRRRSHRAHRRAHRLNGLNHILLAGRIALPDRAGQVRAV